MPRPMQMIPMVGLSVLCTAMVAVGAVTVHAADDSAQAPYRAVVGEPHPDFVLPNIKDGQPLQLSDYRGRKVLLIHFASW